MRFLGYLAGVLAAIGLAATATAQELPVEVGAAYSEYETAIDDEDWDRARDAALRAASAADAAMVEPPLRMVLWENSGLANSRAGRLGPAQDHLARALVLAAETGDADSQARLNYLLFTHALADKGTDVALIHLADFQTISGADRQVADAYERQMLHLALTEMTYLNAAREDGISPQQWRWLQRLETISPPGSEHFIFVRRIRLTDALRRADWDAATALTGQILAHLPDGEDGDLVLDEVTTQFNLVLIFGYGDRSGDGADRLPAEARAVWCAALAAEPVVIWQRVPAVNIRVREGESLFVEVDYTITAEGRMTGFSARPSGGRASNRAAQIIENAAEDWRWRPQCAPTAEYQFAESRSFNRADFMHGTNPFNTFRGSPSGRGRLFGDEASSLMNGWGRN